ncbi:restriction endonuclease [Flavobacterium beibuense]|uniref:Restriction endonuclease n=1 Tax=Flavobacterium beibuense TaxID=657326 RepID=A0A444WIJ9_9FLAO|nr:restriction endonuclease [Flavobacterium beibuense]RYJ45512.1 restriction endonuclease [Flavobacterium beibuense]
MGEGLKYEQFTRDIYQTLLEREGLTVDVQHNLKIKGKATFHQIDVYWECKVGLGIHKVAIECKNYNKNLSVGRVKEFWSSISDIGNINGIMVTSKGYQKGAKEFAEYYGIKLVVLRETIDEDWEGRVRYLTTTIESISSKVTNIYIKLDKEWMFEKFKGKISDNLNLKLNLTNEFMVVDSKGAKVNSLLELEDRLPILDSEAKQGLKHFYTFNDSYIITEMFGMVKIVGIEFTYNISVGKMKFDYDGKETAKAIMKDVLSGEINFVR